MPNITQTPNILEKSVSSSNDKELIFEIEGHVDQATKIDNEAGDDDQGYFYFYQVRHFVYVSIYSDTKSKFGFADQSSHAKNCAI